MGVNVKYLQDFEGVVFAISEMDEYNERYEKIVGPECVIYGSMEECSELIQIINMCVTYSVPPYSGSYSIWKSPIITNLIEEIADVCIVIHNRMRKYNIGSAIINNDISFKRNTEGAEIDIGTIKYVCDTTIYSLSCFIQGISKCARWKSKPLVDGDVSIYDIKDENLRYLIDNISSVILKIEYLLQKFNIDHKYIYQMIAYKLSERGEKAEAGVYTGKMSKEEFYKQKKEKFGY